MQSRKGEPDDRSTLMCVDDACKVEFGHQEQQLMNVVEVFFIVHALSSSMYQHFRREPVCSNATDRSTMLDRFPRNNQTNTLHAPIL